MTEEQIAKRKWLNKVFYAEKKLTALEDKYKRDKARAERVTQMYGGIDKGKSDSRENGTQKLMDTLMDSREEYDKYAEEFAVARREVESAIETLDDDELEAIFIHRHLNYENVDKIAEIMHYSTRTVKRKYLEGLEKMSPNVLECHLKM